MATTLFFRAWWSAPGSLGSFDPLGFVSFSPGFSKSGFLCSREGMLSMCLLRQMSGAGFSFMVTSPNWIARVSL